MPDNFNTITTNLTKDEWLTPPLDYFGIGRLRFGSVLPHKSAVGHGEAPLHDKRRRIEAAVGRARMAESALRSGDVQMDGEAGRPSQRRGTDIRQNRYGRIPSRDFPARAGHLLFCRQDKFSSCRRKQRRQAECGVMLGGLFRCRLPRHRMVESEGPVLPDWEWVCR